MCSRLAESNLARFPTFVEPAVSPISRPDLARGFALICSTGLKLGIHTHTQFRTLPWIREIEPEPFVEIHPHTAQDWGIREELDRIGIPAWLHRSQGPDQSVRSPPHGAGHVWLW